MFIIWTDNPIDVDDIVMDINDDGFGDDDVATILSFLNDSSKEELNTIPGFSSSKSNKLIRLRPFDSWKDLVRQCHNL